MQRVRQAADVVVRFDRVCAFLFSAGRFDHIRIDGSLAPAIGHPDILAASRWNTSTNSRPMIWRFVFGIGYALQVCP